MNQASDSEPSGEILSRFDELVRRNAAPEPGTRIERTGAIVRVVGSYNCIVYSNFRDASADREIARQKSHFDRLGQGLEWKVYGHDQPADLGDRLRRVGFEPDEMETLVALDLRRGVPESLPPPGVDYVRVSDADGLADLAAVSSDAFETDYSWLPDELLPRITAGTVSPYVAYEDGEPVCAGRLETPRGNVFAGLYGGGTVPGRRRRGLYRGLVAVRAQEAVQRGYRFLTVDAMDTSLPILESLGFVPLTRVTSWLWWPRAERP